MIDEKKLKAEMDAMRVWGMGKKVNSLTSDKTFVHGFCFALDILRDLTEKGDFNLEEEK